MSEQNHLHLLLSDFRDGAISRRAFLERAAGIGMATPLALFLAQTASAGAQDASPAAATPATAITERPEIGTEGQIRGSGGELKLIQWQAPSTMSLHLSASFNDMLAAALVTEPLLHFLPDGTPIPNLVKEIPTIENGLLAEDFLSVTYNLLEDVLWSDGEPFTASDVVFTWNWIMDRANSSPNSGVYGALANVEAIDDLTVKLTFAAPQLGWYTFFASCVNGGIYPEHVLGSGGVTSDEFAHKPIGTGPFKVDSFAPNDQAIYSANDNYREPNKPYFASVNLKGGGDAATAATAVLQTGDWDFAWNLQVSPDVLKHMAENSDKGDLVLHAGTGVEWIAFNFSDPNKEVDGQRSQWQTPNPVLSDKAVRQALNLAIDRQSISENLYFGPPNEPPGRNVLTGIPIYESPNTTWEYNIDKANQLLDDAGWVLDGSVRSKDGVELAITYATSTNQIRQQTQAVVKQGWENIGVKVRLLEVDASVFFSTAPGNDQTVQHMYWDAHEYAYSPAGPWPLSYMFRWVSHDGTNIPQAGNNWSQVNEGRYNNPDYDALYDEAASTTDPDRAAELFIAMNDIIIDDVVLIPLVQRASEKYAISKTLRNDNVGAGPFEALYWNIANWNRIS
jgi:peptide/nickel transport system substrate-binding protein